MDHSINVQAASTMAGALSGLADRYTRLFQIASMAATVLNVVLNLYATSFISARLPQHRRMVVARLGDEAVVTQHVQLVAIFLESAAFNIPITITAVVGVWIQSVLGPAVAVVGLAGQVCYPLPENAYGLTCWYIDYQALASILIIHHVALGRAFDQQRGVAETTELVKRTEDSASGDPTTA